MKDGREKGIGKRGTERRLAAMMLCAVIAVTSMPQEAISYAAEAVREGKTAAEASERVIEGSVAFVEETEEICGGKVPNATASDAKKEKTTPSDAAGPNGRGEQRAPESFYTEEIEKEEGILVSFDEYSRTYLVEKNSGADKNGKPLNTYVTVIGGYDGRYVDEEGQLRKIDNTLVTEEEKGEKDEKKDPQLLMSAAPGTEEESGEADTTYRNVSGDADITIRSSGEAAAYTVEKSGYSLKVTPLHGDYSRSMTDENAVRYTDVYENIDVQYTVQNGMVREDIIILEKQERNTFKYRLEAGGLKGKQIGNSVYFKDKEENTVFVMSAPIMTDALGEFSVKIETEYESSSGTVTFTADRDWLMSEEREYPVRIDPDTVLADASAFTVYSVAKGDNTAAAANGMDYDAYWRNFTFPVDQGTNRAGYYPDWGHCKVLIKTGFDFTTLASRMSGPDSFPESVFTVTPETEDGCNSTLYMLREITADWDAEGLNYNTARAQGLFGENSTEIAGPSMTERNNGGNYREMEFSLNGMAVGGTSDVITSWVKGERICHGFIIEAAAEPDPRTTTDLMMADSFFTNTTNAGYGPKIKLKYQGHSTPEDLAVMSIEESTVDFAAGVEESPAGGKTVKGVAVHGITQTGATVDWSIEGSSEAGTTKGEEDCIYPDAGVISEDCLPIEDTSSNWQGEPALSLPLDTIFRAEAAFSGNIYEEVEEDAEDKEYDEEDIIEAGEKKFRITGTVQKAVTSEDEFLLYKVKAGDYIPRIASHYGVTVQQIQEDNRIGEQLAYQDDVLLIRNPKTSEPYTRETGDTLYEFLYQAELLGFDDVRCCFDMEPVNMNTGNFYLTATDAELCELSGTYGITRSYNSLMPYIRTEFGFGWNSVFGDRIMVLKDGTILYTMPDGKGVTFVRTGEKSWKAPASYGMSIFAEEDTEDLKWEEAEDGTCESIKVPVSGGWKLTKKDGTVLIFNACGLMEKKTDRRGHTYLYYYDEDYLLTGIDTPSGKHFTVEQDEKGVTRKITLPDGNNITYGYDSDCNLITVTDPAGTVRYEYDREHRMTAWYDRNGTKITANAYDGKGRVSTQKDAEGCESRLSYEEGLTMLTGNDGKLKKYSFDEKGRTTGVIYEDGITVRKEWGEDGNLAACTDVSGVTRYYEYDEKGNSVKERRTDGAEKTIGYNIENLPVKEKDFNGNEDTYTYDEKGNMTAYMDAEGNKTEFSYDELSRLTAVTDADGYTTSYAYEGSQPVPESFTDAKGNVTTYEHDGMYRLIKTLYADGSYSENTYDSTGRTVIEKTGDGGITEYTYDAAGYVRKMKDPVGAVSEFEFAGTGNILRGKDVYGNTITYGYDKNQNRVSETDANGNETKYSYDQRGHVVSVTDAKGNAKSYTLSGDGRVLAETDRKGNTVTVNEYDKDTGFLTSTEDALGNKTTFSYDLNGRLTGKRYPDGTDTEITYDKAGRVVEVRTANGPVTEITYDGRGNIVSMSDDPERVYRFDYDANGNLTGMTDPLGNETLYEYDLMDRLIQVTDPEGNVTEYGYDKGGRVAAATDAEGNTSTFEYDHNGFLTEETDRRGNTYRYERNLLGELKRSTDPEGRVTEYEYDGNGNVVKVTDALFGETLYEYDAAGLVSGKTKRDGSTESYEYDENGLITEVIYADGGKISFTYDAGGNIKTTTDEAGLKTVYTYDEMGRVIIRADNAGNCTTCEYDESGSVISVADVLGRAEKYEYDNYGRVVKKTAKDGSETLYGYDVLDRLIKRTEADGSEYTFRYDGNGILIEETGPGNAEGSEKEGAEGRAVIRYETDRLGNVTGITDALGEVVTAFYDEEGNTVKITDAEGYEESYEYDKTGLLTGKTDKRGNRTSYVYDALGRLVTETTPEGAETTYTYDLSSNVSKVTDALLGEFRYEYNVMGGLVKRILPNGAEITYGYDKHGNPVSEKDAYGNETGWETDLNGNVVKTVNGTGAVTVYDYDAVNRLRRIRRSDGYTLTLTYTQGDDVESITDNLYRTESYSYDIMHRMTEVRDAYGNAVSYAYDKRGNLTEKADTGGNITSYGYDLKDRITWEMDAKGGLTEYIYDRRGDRVREVKPEGRETGLEYDGEHNITKITDPEGNEYTFRYDKDGRNTEITDPLGGKTEYAYDALGRITKRISAEGINETYAYNSVSELTGYTDGKGNTTSYEYDLNGRISRVITPKGFETICRYDAQGNVTEITDALGRLTKYSFDESGNLTKTTDALGRTTKCEYDAAGALIKKTTPSGDTVRYDYDKLDRLVGKHYENKTNY